MGGVCTAGFWCTVVPSSPPSPRAEHFEENESRVFQQAQCLPFRSGGQREGRERARLRRGRPDVAATALRWNRRLERRRSSRRRRSRRRRRPHRHSSDPSQSNPQALFVWPSTRTARPGWAVRALATNPTSNLDSSRTCESLPLNETGSLNHKRRAPTSTPTDLPC